MNKLTTGEKLFVFANYAFMVLLILIMVYPFWYVAMYSLSDSKLAASGGLFLVPKGFSLASYKTVLSNVSFLSGFKVSIIVTIAGTLLGTFFTATTAYAISKKGLEETSRLLC